MKATFDSPKALPASTAPGLYNKLKECNKSLAVVQKGLDRFLEQKRQGFPRFYFLSNDDLLAILAENNNPLVVQPYMNKCFDGFFPPIVCYCFCIAYFRYQASRNSDSLMIT